MSKLGVARSNRAGGAFSYNAPTDPSRFRPGSLQDASGFFVGGAGEDYSTKARRRPTHLEDSEAQKPDRRCCGCRRGTPPNGWQSCADHQCQPVAFDLLGGAGITASLSTSASEPASPLFPSTQTFASSRATLNGSTATSVYGAAPLALLHYLDTYSIMFSR